MFGDKGLVLQLAHDWDGIGVENLCISFVSLRDDGRRTLVLAH